MTRKFIVALSVAALLVFTLAVTAMAADPAPAYGAGPNANAMHNYVDANGDGLCDNFSDADGDGICDNAAGRPQPEARRDGRPRMGQAPEPLAVWAVMMRTAAGLWPLRQTASTA